MRNFKYILSFLAITSLFFASCETQELYPRFGEGDGQSSVAFTSASSSVGESSTIAYADGTSTTGGSVATINLVRRSADISAALNVSVTYTATYTSDNEFVTAGEDASDAIKITDNLEEISFPANSATTSFQLTTINDVEPAGDVEVVFTISSVGDSKYQIGEQSGKSRSTYTLTVVDDDCPIDIPGVWEGIYVVTEMPAAPGSFNEGFSVGGAVGRQVLLELDPSDPLGATAILKPTESNSFLVDEMPLAFQACPETVLIGDDVFTLAFNQNGAPAAIGRSDEPAVYGNGTFNPDGSSITIVVGYGNINLGLVFDEFLISLERLEE